MAKKTKEKDLTVLSEKELDDMLKNLKEELRKLRFDKAFGVNSERDSSSILKKQVARVMTVLSAKKLGGASE